MKFYVAGLPLAFFLASTLASAQGITEKCDSPGMRAKVARELNTAYQALGGSVNMESVKVTPVLPKELLQPGQAAVLATAEISVPYGDEGEFETALFAGQFSMNYDTCEPALTGSGRLL